jgi:hypothetical protein
MNDNTTNDALLKKISKLLALGNSANENEAQSAMAMAQALMDKHNIEMTDIEHATQEFTKLDFSVGKRVSRLDSCVFNILGQFFHVRVWRTSGGNMTVFGAKHNLQIAMYAYAFLDATFTRLWAEYKVVNNATTIDRDPFFAGLAAGLRTKICRERDEAKQRAQSEGVNTTGALIRVDNALAVAFRQLGIQLSNGASRSTRTGDSYHAGKAAGGNINMRSGVNGGSTQKKLGGG